MKLIWVLSRYLASTAGDQRPGVTLAGSGELKKRATLPPSAAGI